MAGDALGECEDGGHVHGHAHLVDGQIGVGRDDGAPRKVNALAGQVPPETPLLSLQPLHKPPACHATREIIDTSPCQTASIDVIPLNNTVA